MNKKLKVIFLGGVGEIGKNMTAIEYDETILIIDAGMSFPSSSEMPGIDIVIPDYQYLVKNKSKVKGLVITHGHEDHIGCLPYILKDIPDLHVFGGKLSLALMQHKLYEAGIKHEYAFEVEAGDCMTIGTFNVEFIQVTHSIANAFAVAVRTPKGLIFHTGDFKIDYTPVDKKPFDINRIAEIGKEGVLLMMQDSTNVERSGYSMSETNVGISMDNLFGQNIGKRLIVATFASNVHRVQQIINCCVKYNRKVAFCGRSMIKIAEIAKSLKELTYPEDIVVDIDKSSKVPYDRICIISTGTQGEPLSALSRMAKADFRQVAIGTNDTVVLSSSPIPGNEKMIYRVINDLSRLGANVIYSALSDVHVSGHACKEELKLMFALLRPTYFVPVHGEYRHLKLHAELAESMGINRANIIVPELGNVINIEKYGIRRDNSVQSGCILIDGNTISENVEVVLRDRKTMSEDGLVIALVICGQSNEIVPPAILFRGISISEEVQEELRVAIQFRLNECRYEEMDLNETKQTLKKHISKILFSRCKKRPMVMPLIVEN